MGVKVGQCSNLEEAITMVIQGELYERPQDKHRAESIGVR